MVYIRHMFRTQIYLPEDLYREIGFIAKREKKKKAQVIRETLKTGVDRKKTKQTAGEALLKLAAMAKKYNWKGPRDLSINHDKYLYEDV